MGTFKLEPVSAQGLSPQLSGGDGLGRTVLLQNARWFTQIRWVVVAVFAGFGAVGNLAPDLLKAVGIVPPAVWPWVLAGTLTLINLVVIEWLRRMSYSTTRMRVEFNIWFQIVADLFVLTALVYLAGTMDTIIPFAYLFHITLACIFFARRESLIVALLSALLFLTLVALEVSAELPHRGILVRSGLRHSDSLSLLTTAVPTIFVGFVVWYLVSTISAAVRQRDRELDTANTRLLKADEEKNLQVLRVTHDLKAPFVGIETNIQLLRAAYWNDLPQAVRDIISKIDARGATLRARIGDILTLGNLRSSPDVAPTLDRVELRTLLDSVIQEVQGLASKRNVSIVLAAAEETVWSDVNQLKVLFLNLIANAASYSREGGSVQVEAKGGKPTRVSVTDRGIGISEKALPHIFDDFYRTSEAARFNPQSTGLGLAIVRQIARNLLLTVNVNSKEGEGTTFEVVFP